MGLLIFVWCVICIVTMIFGTLLAWIAFFVHNHETQYWHWSFAFKWFDCWVGCYFDQANNVIYLCPLPMCVIKLTLEGKK